MAAATDLASRPDDWLRGVLQPVAQDPGPGFFRRAASLVASGALCATGAMVKAKEVVYDGFGRHDIDARSEFVSFVQRAATVNWSGPTWLLDTGDDTTFGDRKSVSYAQDLLDEVSPWCARRLVLYGNHDAWPKDFPLGGLPGRVRSQRRFLVRRHINESWPREPAILSREDLDIEVYGLHSVLHGRLTNSAALGWLTERFWSQRFPRWGEDFVAVRHRAQRCDANRNGKPRLRILATHHPIARVDRLPHHRVLNGSSATSVLGREESLGFQLVLSGHTHDLFPAHSELGATPADNAHGPLGHDHVQMVIGTLMQHAHSYREDDPQSRGRWPHQAAVLRILWDEVRSEAVVRRLLAGRRSGIDESYEYRPTPDGRDYEELRIPL